MRNDVNPTEFEGEGEREKVFFFFFFTRVTNQVKGKKKLNKKVEECLVFRTDGRMDFSTRRG